GDCSVPAGVHQVIPDLDAGGRLASGGFVPPPRPFAASIQYYWRQTWRFGGLTCLRFPRSFHVGISHHCNARVAPRRTDPFLAARRPATDSSEQPGCAHATAGAVESDSGRIGHARCYQYVCIPGGVPIVLDGRRNLRCITESAQAALVLHLCAVTIGSVWPRLV